ncbi:MAG: MbcA/ParS/Xre antitoxin family protein [Pseudomonadota bacterium]|nr:MbcA/ParS/Xre antitoxin family protein [Pseudomonadota bacterium]
MLVREPRRAYGDSADLLTAQTAASALAVFFRMADRWGLEAGQKQALLGTSRSVYYRWQAGEVTAPLDPATAERLSYLFRIYAALQVLLPVRERADAWLQAPNSAALFGGGTALARMLGGQVGDLKVVADFLDAQRGGDFA